MMISKLSLFVVPLRVFQRNKETTTSFTSKPVAPSPKTLFCWTLGSGPPLSICAGLRLSRKPLLPEGRERQRHNKTIDFHPLEFSTCIKQRFTVWARFRRLFVLLYSIYLRQTDTHTNATTYCEYFIPAENFLLISANR